MLHELAGPVVRATLLAKCPVKQRNRPQINDEIKGLHTSSLCSYRFASTGCSVKACRESRGLRRAPLLYSVALVLRGGSWDCYSVPHAHLAKKSVNGANVDNTVMCCHHEISESLSRRSANAASASCSQCVKAAAQA